VILGILLVKSTIWAVSLGSGTSGGVLAPLLMMGAALGGVEALVLPYEGVGFWPLVSMGAILGGTMRVPFTAVIFTLELTHDVYMMLPLLVAVSLAYATTVMLMSRSILTEKIARRGYHLSREYAIDPLEILFVREVMRTDTTALSLGISITELEPQLVPRGQRVQHLFPVLDAEGRLAGVITRRDLRHAFQLQQTDSKGQRLDELLRADPVLAYADEPLRVVVNRMAETGLTRFPVVERNEPYKLRGTISLNDLLHARVLNLEGERRRERILQLPRITSVPKVRMRV
jgi:CBS domain-containing protein